jgi:hypothetical protein
VAKANNLDLTIEEVDEKKPAEFLKANKLGKVPTFVGSDGYVLSECIAVAIYSKILPASAFDAQVLVSTAENKRPSILFHDDLDINCYSYPYLKTFVLTWF